LKNVEVGALTVGQFNKYTSSPTSTKLQVQALVKYCRAQLKKAWSFYIGHWTQFITAKVEEASDAGDPKLALTITLDKPLAYRQHTAVLIS
jgi:hypothetical protein